MDSSKTVALLLIVIALAGIYLHSGHQLTPLYNELKNAPNSKTGTNIAQIVIAIVVYIVILSFIPDDYAVPITIVVLLGALLVNHQKQGTNDLIAEISSMIANSGG